MGHLINPIAYRLGHTRSWEDNWFIKNVYYPEFLHSMLKIRHFIYYFWTTREMEKKGILLSHFYINKFVKNLLIKIFIYNIDMEKNIYALFARGVGIFSDSFHYRLKKKKKKKEPYSYDRYKPDLFFFLFLFFSYFTRSEVKLRKYKRKGFFYKSKKNRAQIVLQGKKRIVEFDTYNEQFNMYWNSVYLDNLKNNNLKSFINIPKISEKNKKFLNIYSYEKKIKLLKEKKINMGFLDFMIYLFFKINMLEKEEDDKLRYVKRRRSLEMVLNYPRKIERWIMLLKNYVKIKIKLNKNKKRSIRNFIFFLTFIINIVYKVRERSSRVRFKLQDLNLKLMKVFVFSKIFTKFAKFYGDFLRHILFILTKINKFNFKFCIISNNSVNARFLTRYIGLKLRKKFPLFFVINPLKKELRKLSGKKKDKKIFLWANYSLYKIKLKQISLDYKETFRSTLLYLNNKYLEVFMKYFKSNLTLVTSDLFVYLLLLKKRHKYPKYIKSWKEKFVLYFSTFIWKKKKKVLSINKQWIMFIYQLFKYKKNNLYLLNKLNLLSIFYTYIKNKLLINLFFGMKKYDVDTLGVVLFSLKNSNDSFFFFNSDLLNLTVYSFFFNSNLLNLNSLLKINSNNFTMTNYLFQTYMYYLYSFYTFSRLIDFLNINKRKIYLKTRQLHRPSSFILGFKMSFKGRFTRKQRASSIWFHQGLVPLNTIKGHVDYSFFMIPLKNSAVSIKLWLYKSTNQMFWDQKYINKRMEKIIR